MGPRSLDYCVMLLDNFNKGGFVSGLFQRQLKKKCGTFPPDRNLFESNEVINYTDLKYSALLQDLSEINKQKYNWATAMLRAL